jgi:hypothetical protein
MFIASLNKEITIGTKTRKIVRDVNEAMLSGVVVTEGVPPSIPAINADRSEEIMVRLMSGLSQSEIDSLSQEEYLSIKEEIAKKK